MRKDSNDSRGRGDVCPRPGDFPVGSLESRAAARAMLGEAGLEVGTSGFTEEGHFYHIIPGPDGQPVKMIWDIPVRGCVQLRPPGKFWATSQ